VSLDPERRRLQEDRAGSARWKWWGPYLAARQWGTVREDYSPHGDAWEYFPHDHARSRAYRWGEDGLGGICDRWQHLCFGLALWNGRDPILKERLFGLTNREGNHGEDAKEYWWPLDATPTSSWLRWLYKYPQAPFPYEQLTAVNQRRGLTEPEYDLVDTGVFDDDRYFDVVLTYAKAGPDDICIEIAATNLGPDPAELHLLPTVWFRNTWAWGRDDRRPNLGIEGGAIRTEHDLLGTHWLLVDDTEPTAGDGDGSSGGQWLVCDNETDTRRLWGVAETTPWPKSGIGDHVLHNAATVNPAGTGTKAAWWALRTVAPGATTVLRLRLTDAGPGQAQFGVAFDEILRQRATEADQFYAGLPEVHDADGSAAPLRRRALAGLLWNMKHYRYDISEWLDGDPGLPPPPPERQAAYGRNHHWRHLRSADIISMPDEWEYPWFAAWDLAFHTLPLAMVDAEAAKAQLILLCREWYMHPNGQLPAYEWAFEDVNPPVHAWAAWRVYQIDAAATGVPDRLFLERIFHKLLLNFGWWVNRKDVDGNNLFEGGFMGLDNIGLFDRSRPLPGGQSIEQSDATSWLAMYCLDMLTIAVELAREDAAYEDVCTKFFEHFLAIGAAATQRRDIELWDDTDGFFYDVLIDGMGARVPLRVRSWVGLIPLFASAVFDAEVLDHLPDFRWRVNWLLRRRPAGAVDLFLASGPDASERSDGPAPSPEPGPRLGPGTRPDPSESRDPQGDPRRHLLTLVGPERLRRILSRMLDENEFLSPFGLRSLSRDHDAHPVRLDLDGHMHEVRYQPSDSDSPLFGGNSNWRGPVWFPLNHLMVESLRIYHQFLGDDFTVECPTGSGRQLHLGQVADELARRLVSLFTPDADGRRPANGGVDRFDLDPHWRDHPTFYEYFHGDTGAGLGASHQTGWTALVASLLT
jgi:hypothetical protein